MSVLGPAMSPSKVTVELVVMSPSAAMLPSRCCRATSRRRQRQPPSSTKTTVAAAAAAPPAAAPLPLEDTSSEPTSVAGVSAGVGAGDNGDGEGGLGLTAAITTVGIASTEIPRANEAADFVLRLEFSDSWTASAVVVEGIAMNAVMMTLAAVTLILTEDSSTPASAATSACSAVVSE